MFVLHAHLVFVTKSRHPVFSSQHLGRMEQIMRDVCTDFGCDLAEFNGEASHVHLLVNFPPKVALSRLVNSLKGVSSRRLRQEFPGLRRHYWKANRLWSGSYFRRVRRRRTHHGPAPVHPTAGQARLISAGVRPPSPPA